MGLLLQLTFGELVQMEPLHWVVDPKKITNRALTSVSHNQLMQLDIIPLMHEILLYTIVISKFINKNIFHYVFVSLNMF